MTGHKHHFETLDGLRGVAALLVVAYHRKGWIALSALPYGYLAVDFFFLLSGFVIACAYEKELKAARLSFGAFAVTRAIRLGPLVALGALLGALVSALSGGGVLVWAALPLAAASLPAPWLERPFEINEPAWSLFYEILANLAYAAAAVFLTTRRLAALLFLSSALLATVVVSEGTIGLGTEWPEMGLALIRVAAPFLAGILLFRLWEAGSLPSIKAPFWALSAILALVLVMPKFSPEFQIVFILVACLVIFPAIIVAGCQCEPTGFWGPIARLSGALSFPIYILHSPLLGAFDLWRGEYPPHTRVSLLAYVLAVCALAWLALKYFDEPVRAWLRSLWQRRTAIAIPAAAPSV